MKLKNKKTGEIEEFENITRAFKFIGNQNTYNSLAELNEEWEDYEEPKEYWRIGCDGLISQDKNEFDTPFDNNCKSIGNYFETREEAELAVRKLKAWKRLKDKGFRFNNFVRDAIYYEISDEEIKKDIVRNDLELLFGGEK